MIYKTKKSNWLLIALSIVGLIVIAVQGWLFSKLYRVPPTYRVHVIERMQDRISQTCGTELNDVCTDYFNQVPIGQMIEAGSDTTYAVRLGKGFRQPEPWGTWLEGREGQISLSLPEDESPAYFIAEITIFEGVAGLDVEWKANDQLVKTSKGLTAGDHELRIPLEDVSLDEGRLNIAVIPSDSKTPKELGLSDDGRSLSIGLIRYGLE